MVVVDRAIPAGRRRRTSPPPPPPATPRPPPPPCPPYNSRLRHEALLTRRPTSPGQELVIDRETAQGMSAMRLVSSNVASVLIEQAGDDGHFRKVVQRELEPVEGKLQVNTIPAQTASRYVRLKILSGRGDFVSVVSVEIQ